MVAGVPTPLHVRRDIWELHKDGANTTEIVEQLARYNVKRRTVQLIVKLGRQAEDAGLDIDAALTPGTSPGRPPLLNPEQVAALLAAVEENPAATLVTHAKVFNVAPETIGRVLEANGIASRRPTGRSRQGNARKRASPVEGDGNARSVLRPRRGVGADTADGEMTPRALEANDIVSRRPTGMSPAQDNARKRAPPLQGDVNARAVPRPRPGAGDVVEEDQRPHRRGTLGLWRVRVEECGMPQKEISNRIEPRPQEG